MFYTTSDYIHVKTEKMFELLKYRRITFITNIDIKVKSIQIKEGKTKNIYSVCSSLYNVYSISSYTYVQ